MRPIPSGSRANHAERPARSDLSLIYDEPENPEDVKLDVAKALENHAGYAKAARRPGPFRSVETSAFGAA